MHMKSQLEAAINALIAKLFPEISPEVSQDSLPVAELTRPQDMAFGDFATNVALQLSGKLKSPPKIIAEKLVNELSQNQELKKFIFSIAGPGFINIKVPENYYIDNLLNISENYGQQSINSKKIVVEFGQPNTHKVPHIGHLYSYIAGSTLAKILETVGNKIIRANYQGDVGPHVAKCLYGWNKRGNLTPKEGRERAEELQLSYQLGSKLYEEDPEAKLAIDQLNRQIYQKDPSILEIWQQTRQWSLDYYQEFESYLGITQDKHYLESEVWQKGMDLVKENVGKVFELSEGAIVFPGEKYGKHTRVFITKAGNPTYEAKDLGLSYMKMQDWQYDLAIVTTASEQNDYFDVVITAIGETLPELKGKVKHIGFGMVNLSTGKMSSRTGQILSAPNLVDQVSTRFAEILKSRDSIPAAEIPELNRKLTLGAIKYAFLRGNIMQNMTFDIEESVSFEGNSGPYLQYTYARIRSVLRQIVAELSGESELPNSEALSDLLTLPQERTLLRLLERLPETITGAAKNYAPHLIASYVFDIAQEYNSYYKNASINSAGSAKLIAARRLLSEKVAICIRRSLELLGIETVEQM